MTTSRVNIIPRPGEYDYGLYNINYKQNTSGKLDLSGCFGFKSHRSGWGAVMEQLKELHNSDGVFVDCFIERTFGWMSNFHINNGAIPYKKPWVGFIHNPVGVPTWYKDFNKLQFIFDNQQFQESLMYCRGLYTLSKDLKAWVISNLDNRYNVPIESILHPHVSKDYKCFTVDLFKRNNNKMIIDVGTWLRKQTTLYKLQAPGEYSKVKLWPKGHEEGSTNRKTMERFLEYEVNYLHCDNFTKQGVSNIDSVSDLMYDHLLSQNIVLLDCWDTSANNTVVECIERSTPILCPKLPALIEYLGIDYPFCFEDIPSITSLLTLEKIRECHEYLNLIKISDKLSIKKFIQGIESSHIYRRL